MAVKEDAPFLARKPVAGRQNSVGRFRANRFGVLVDGDDYLRAVKAALLVARRQVLIVGWDFDSRIRLDRRDPPDGQIGKLLDTLVRDRPELEVRLLIWDSPLLYSFDREPLTALKLGLLSHPRIVFQFDNHHPQAASHHQKIVVVDDAVAFVGGIDITSCRWDTRAHLPQDPLRADIGDGICPPVHDVQAIVDGPAARALGEIARERWRLATGQSLPEPDRSVSGLDLWPSWLMPLLRCVPVAIARTAPDWDGQAEVREAERLFLDMIASARQFLYLECQYLASWRVGNALATRLDELDGPEIVIVTSKESVALLEEMVMGASRTRLLARLHARDHAGRLHLFWPRNVNGSEIKVHAKLTIVDDVMLRVGSTNFNNRSMGLDTECDVLVEAQDALSRLAIRGFRQDLLAEHLGVAPAQVAVAEAANPTMSAAIAALSGPGRSLAALPEPETSDFFGGGEILDLDSPLESAMPADSLPTPASSFSRNFPRFGLLIALCGVFAATWGLMPSGAWNHVQPYLEGLDQWRGHPFGLAVTALIFVLGGLISAPVTILILITAMIFGPWGGILHASIGTLASASVLYFLGGRFGRGTLSRFSGRRLSQINRSLARHGIVAMAILRLVPVAPFTIINLVAGASLIRFRNYLAGTALGMAPGIVGASLFGDRIGAVLRTPDLVNVATLAGSVLALIGLGFLLAWHLVRQRRAALKSQGAGGA
jgi:phospholipase D1/2